MPKVLEDLVCRPGDMADAFLRLHRRAATTCKDHSPATRGQTEVEGKAKLSNFQAVWLWS